MSTMTTSAGVMTRDRIGSGLDGQLLLPGDAGYDDTRTVWNALVDRRPAMIVRCVSVGDVVTAVRAARDLDLEIGIRCGGHGALGFAVPDQGVMIDLSPMGGVRVDPLRRRAWVQGGALLGALDTAAQRYGLATTAGNVSHTGVGGLTLGGGMGWLARQYRLTCDNVISFEVVTATGEVVRASRHSHPDLYWGLRGGGGNFGVVTEFEFRLHPVGNRALVAELSFPVVPARRALDALRGWRDLLLAAPREATYTASIGSDGMAVVGFVWIGDPAQGRRLLPALRALGRPSAERVLELTYLGLQRMSDTVQKHALRRYSKGHYLRELPDGALEAFLGRGVPSGAGDGGDYLPNVGFQAYGGAIADVPDQDTPFSHRDALVEYGAGTSWSDPAQDEARIAAARRCAAALDQYASGAYVNFVNDEGTEGVLRAYSAEKLARLAAVKSAYDPDNVFHLNHNIKPASR
jgi:FAD/FMN-containing dehydrogenase